MTHRCINCSSNFDVPAQDLAFLDKVGPTLNGKHFPIPAPTHCPDCRLQRRLSYRNEFVYFTRSCDCCKKRIVSIHSPDAPYPVYCYQCWWADAWDPFSFGRDVDPGKSFFEQFAALQSTVPQIAMMNDNGVGSENCEYCHDFSFSKNCYLVTASWENQDCMYSSQSNGNKEAFDCFLINKSELVYESVLGYNLYNCGWLMASFGCNDCFFGYDLRECKDCIGCVGLRQAQYHLFNKKLTKESYFKEVDALQLNTRSGQAKCRSKFDELLSNFPRRAVNQLNCEDCDGDALQHCKETQGFGIMNAERSRYIWQGDGMQDSLDLQVTGKAQWCYEGATVDNSYETHFSLWTWKNKYLLYCDNCHSSENLFGCIGIRRGSNSILNKQYTPEAYQVMAAKIIEGMKGRGEWGEFFPTRLSPFPYNETRANDVSSLTREEAQSLKLRWREPNVKDYQTGTVAPPDSLNDVKDEITSELLACIHCRKNYKILKPELKVYRKLNMPIPDSCPDCRRKVRFSRYPSTGRLFSRECTDCGLGLHSSFSKQLAPQVLCHSCYEKRLES